MSYYLKVDPENTLKGTIISPDLNRSTLPPGNGLIDKVYYEIPIEKVQVFEACMKFNCIDYTYDSDSCEESVLYILPYSEFTFIDADIIEFDPCKTFGKALEEVELAIEENGPGSAIEFSTHPKYQYAFERFITNHNYEFEFLEEDDNSTRYLISRRRFPFPGEANDRSN